MNKIKNKNKEICVKAINEISPKGFPLFEYWVDGVYKGKCHELKMR